MSTKSLGGFTLFTAALFVSGLWAGRGAAALASGMTIQPGTYPLEWKVPDMAKHFDPGSPSDGPGESLYWFELKPVGASSGRTYRGLKSANAFAGRGGGLFVLVDESKGSATGYDTAYIVASKADLAVFDVAQAVKVSLKDNPGKFYGATETDSMLSLSDKLGELFTEICTGEPGDQVTKRAAVDGFNIRLRQTGARAEPCIAEVTLRGGWYGNLKTSKGELQVRATDENGNGVYGDKVQPGWETGGGGCGDMIYIIRGKRREQEQPIELAEAVQIDGQLYSVDVSKTGTRLDIKPYGGETGFLSVGATDGKGRRADCESIIYSGDKGHFWPAGDQPVKAPVGNYRCSASIGAGVYVASPLAALGKDRTVRFAIGGPLHFEVALGADAIRAKAGEDKQIEMTVYAGQDIMHFASSGKFTATITDAAGKTVAEQTVGNHRSEVQCTQVFTIPKSLKPGAYTVDVRLDARPYQEPLSVKKKLVVDVGGTVREAWFREPSGVAVDSAGNVFVADTANCTIRKVTPDGVVTTLAGSAGVSGTNDGTGSAARFNYPHGVAVDSGGNVFVADRGNDAIRKVTPAGVVTTLAGSAGTSGSADGTGSAARFSCASSVAVDSAGNLYVAVDNRISKVTLVHP